MNKRPKTKEEEKKERNKYNLIEVHFYSYYILKVFLIINVYNDI